MSGWISVKDRLPDSDRCVLIYESGYGDYSIAVARYKETYQWDGAYFTKELGWDYRDDMGTSSGPEPDAWMEMPEPYNVTSTATNSTTDGDNSTTQKIVNKTEV